MSDMINALLKANIIDEKKVEEFKKNSKEETDNDK